MNYKPAFSRCILAVLVAAPCGPLLQAGIDENRRRIQKFIDTPGLLLAKKLSQSATERNINMFVDELVDFRNNKRIVRDKLDLTTLFANYKNLPQTHSAADLLRVVATQAYRHSGFMNSVTQTKEIIKRLLVNEVALLQQNKVPFVHGLEGEIFFLMDLYTQAWSVVNNRPVSNFTFVRFNDLNLSPVEQAKQHQKHEEMRRKIMGGKEFYSAFDPARILFMNSSIVGNYDQEKSFTLKYCVADESMTPPTLDVAQVARMVGMRALFAKYKKEIEALASQHKKLCHGKGVIFQVAFTDKAMRERVYVAAGGGAKHKATIKRGSSTYNTDDVALVTKLIRSNPALVEVESNSIEFCMVIDDIDPGQGVEMYPFYNAPASELRAYQQKRDQLFAQMKQERSSAYKLAMKANYANVQNLPKHAGGGRNQPAQPAVKRAAQPAKQVVQPTAKRLPQQLKQPARPARQPQPVVKRAAQPARAAVKQPPVKRAVRQPAVRKPVNGQRKR